MVGQTHPRVVETHGEAYRDRLFALVDEHALGAQVSFDDRYPVSYTHLDVYKRQRLDDGQAEGLVEVDEVQQRPGPAEQ